MTFSFVETVGLLGGPAARNLPEATAAERLSCLIIFIIHSSCLPFT